MAHYKHIDTSPRFLAVDLEAQLLPGSFEHALNHLLDHEIDLGAFDARFNNDEVGASAYPPAMLLKVVVDERISCLCVAQLQDHPSGRRDARPPLDPDGHPTRHRGRRHGRQACRLTCPQRSPAGSRCPTDLGNRYQARPLTAHSFKLTAYSFIDRRRFL